MTAQPLTQPSTRITDGVAILDPSHTELLAALDTAFTGWAREAGAAAICPPPLYPVADLEKLDVYANFPQLSLVAGPLAVTAPPAHEAGRFTAEETGAAPLGLPMAACFGCYLYLEGTRLTEDRLLTLVNRCFRRETRFDGLRRLLTFQMREIVAVGGYQHTQDVLAHFTSRIERFAADLSLGLVRIPATDPFFREDRSRDLLQRLNPVKHEFQVGGLAVSSVNTHRNFFGERCRITLPDGQYAFTSCVAFGLERWLAVLLDRHGGDAWEASAAVREAAAQWQPA